MSLRQGADICPRLGHGLGAQGATLDSGCSEITPDQVLLPLHRPPLRRRPARRPRGNRFDRSLSSVTASPTRATSTLCSTRPTLFLPITPSGRFTDGADTMPASRHLYNAGGTDNVIWHEQLAKTLGVPIATPSLQGGNNYAYGSATTGVGTTVILQTNTIFGQVTRTVNNMATAGHRLPEEQQQRGFGQGPLHPLGRGQ